MTSLLTSVVLPHLWQVAFTKFTQSLRYANALRGGMRSYGAPTKLAPPPSDPCPLSRSAPGTIRSSSSSNIYSRYPGHPIPTTPPDSSMPTTTRTRDSPPNSTSANPFPHRRARSSSREAVFVDTSMPIATPQQPQLALLSSSGLPDIRRLSIGTGLVSRNVASMAPLVRSAGGGSSGRLNTQTSPPPLTASPAQQWESSRASSGSARDITTSVLGPLATSPHIHPPSTSSTTIPPPSTTSAATCTAAYVPPYSSSPCTASSPRVHVGAGNVGVGSGVVCGVSSSGTSARDPTHVRRRSSGSAFESTRAVVGGEASGGGGAGPAGGIDVQHPPSLSRVVLPSLSNTSSSRLNVYSDLPPSSAPGSSSSGGGYTVGSSCNAERCSVADSGGGSSAVHEKGTSASYGAMGGKAEQQQMAHGAGVVTQTSGSSTARGASSSGKSLASYMGLNGFTPSTTTTTTTATNNGPCSSNSSGGGVNGGGGNSSMVAASVSYYRRLVGLENLGNTCFMNSCLQCLLSTEPLARFFSEGRHRGVLCRESQMKGQIANAFADLAAQVSSMADHTSANPSQLKRVVGKWAPHFSGYDQHDIQEFLRFLLDGLSEDLNRASPSERERAKQLSIAENSKPTTTYVRIEPSVLGQLADETWDRFLMHTSSAITDLFRGQLQSSVRCLTCQRYSFCFDPFMDISLPVPKAAEVMERSSLGGSLRKGLNSVTSSLPSSRPSSNDQAHGCALDDCLRTFTEEEVLDGNDRPVCAHCKQACRSVKRILIHRFPPVLVLHIKRFRFSAHHREKLTTNVKFPLSSLDLTPYASTNHKCVTSSAPPVYDLYAVSNHMGGMGGGHYTAHCLAGSATDSSSSGGWHTLDDSRVSAVSPASMSGSAAYVLFYRQRGAWS